MSTAAEREPTPVEEELSPGHVLDGKYLIDAVLGKGGVGVVVSATHLALQQKVAIKFLRNDTKLSPDTLQRFLREARAAAMIRSEHVARVNDFGTSEEGHPYIVMEHLEGKDLGALLDEGPLTVEAAVEYVLQACLALAEAHRAGIVHRDLKPANLFLTQRADGVPVIKILDFGISKVVPKTARGSNAEFATTSSIMGSPEYMSPEQMRSTKDVDARTDIWALGIVLYELITAHPAFTADTVHELFYAIERTEPTPIEMYARDTPGIVKQVIARCLRKDRAERFADVGELALALRPVASPRAEAHVDAIVSILSGIPSVTKPNPVNISEAPPLLLTRPRVASAPTVDASTAILPTSGVRGKTIGLAVAFVAAAGLLAMLALGAGKPALPAAGTPSVTAPAASVPQTSSVPSAPATVQAQQIPSAVPVEALSSAPPPTPGAPGTPARTSTRPPVVRPLPAPTPTPAPAPTPALTSAPPRASPSHPSTSKPSDGTSEYGDRK
jgi:eukaryotic-like serine/threonine-protein kinase